MADRVVQNIKAEGSTIPLFSPIKPHEFSPTSDFSAISHLRKATDIMNQANVKIIHKPQSNLVSSYKQKLNREMYSSLNAFSPDGTLRDNDGSSADSKEMKKSISANQRRKVAHYISKEAEAAYGDEIRQTTFPSRLNPILP